MRVVFLPAFTLRCFAFKHPQAFSNQASDDLGPGAGEGKLIAHAVKMNVFHSIEFLLKNSEALRELVKGGFLVVVELNLFELQAQPLFLV